MLNLANEIQFSVAARALKPMVRTFYNRTAFQLPGNARVRISLDTELTMIREDNYGHNRSGSSWRRMDCGTIAPFTNLPKDDVCEFKYAVLEVKLQTQHGTTAPQWVQDLIDSHLVEEVPKFSKFIHGVATLLEDRVNLLPFWLPQMDKDIRKPAPLKSPIGPRPVSIAKPPTDEIEILIEHQPLSLEEVSEHTPLIPRQIEPNASSKSLFSIPWFPRSTHMNSGIPQTMRHKRIILPVRVEPKVFFANERTFLSWLHFCIVLGGLALGLLNFGDSVAQISGLLFTTVSMVFMLYALYLYQWRAHKIRTRGIFQLT